MEVNIEDYNTSAREKENQDLAAKR